MNGVPFAASGATEVDRPNVALTVFYALQLFPDTPEPENDERLDTYRDARDALTPREPRVAVLGCGVEKERC